MTISSITDIMVGADILEKTNLKPFWETVKVYSFRVLLLISSIITIAGITLKPIRCSAYQSSNVSFSTSDMLYVGSICSQKLEFQYKYSGILSISISVALYILSDWWKLVPTVRSGFCAVQKVNRKLGEHYVTKPHQSEVVQGEVHQSHDYSTTSSQEQTEDQSKEAIKVEDESSNENKLDNLRVVRDCCRILFFKKGWGLILVYYCLSCMYCLLGTLSMTAIIIYWLVGNVQENITFECDITETSPYHETGKFSCSNDLVEKLKPYVWSFLATQIILSMANFTGIVISLCSLCYRKTHDKSTDMAERLYKDYALILKFSRWSQTLNEQTTWLISNQYSIIEELKQNRFLAIQNWDRHFMSMYMWMHKNGKTAIFIYLKNRPKLMQRDRIKSFSLQFKAAIDNPHMFMKLHDTLMENQDEERFLSCGCEKLEISYKQAKSFLTKAILQERSVQSDKKYSLGTIKHVAFWFNKAHSGVVDDVKNDTNIKRVNKVDEYLAMLESQNPSKTDEEEIKLELETIEKRGKPAAIAPVENKTEAREEHPIPDDKVREVKETASSSSVDKAEENKSNPKKYEKNEPPKTTKNKQKQNCSEISKDTDALLPPDSSSTQVIIYGDVNNLKT